MRTLDLQVSNRHLFFSVCRDDICDGSRLEIDFAYSVHIAPRTHDCPPKLTSAMHECNRSAQWLQSRRRDSASWETLDYQSYKPELWRGRSQLHVHCAHVITSAHQVSVATVATTAHPLPCAAFIPNTITVMLRRISLRIRCKNNHHTLRLHFCIIDHPSTSSFERFIRGDPSSPTPECE